MDEPPGNTFPLFRRFPPEIRAMIWEQQLPDIEPGLCVPRVAIVDDGNGGVERHVQPLIICNSVPNIYYACRESRDAVRRAYGILLNDNGKALAIYRPYDPEQDVVMLCYQFLEHFPLGFWGEASTIKHLAIQLPRTHAQYAVKSKPKSKQE